MERKNVIHAIEQALQKLDDQQLAALHNSLYSDAQVVDDDPCSIGGYLAELDEEPQEASR